MRKRQKKLQERRVEVKAQIADILKSAKADDRELTDDEVKTIEEARTEIEAIDTECATIKANLEAREYAANLGSERDDVPEDESTAPGMPPAAPERREWATAARYSSLRNFKGPNADENAYKSGMWIRAKLFRDERAAEWCKKHGVETRVMGETANTLGGFLVPDVFANTIIDLRELYGVFRRNASVVPMGSETMNIARRLSGLTAYAVGEGDTITASDKGWTNVGLTARKWAVLCRYSTELAEDAVINIADDLAGEIASAFAQKEDDCAFKGDGLSTYHGIVGASVKIDDGTHTASVFDAASGNTAFSTLDLADFEGTVGKIPEYPGIQPKWYISKVGWAASMMRLQDAAGGNTMTDLARMPQRSFMGYPVEFTDSINTTTAADVSAVKLLLGDLRMGATLGDRRGMALQTSADIYFASDEIGLKGTTRYDVVIHGLGDTSAAGPIVALKTPGS